MKKIKYLFLIFILFNISFSQWQPVSNGIEGKDLTQGYVNNNEIWVGAVGSGLYKSTNEGNSWLLSYATSYTPIRFSANLNNIFFIGQGTLSDRIYRSIDNGLNWENVSSGTSGDKWDLITYNNELYLAAYGYGIYKSQIGSSWTQYNNGLNSLNIQCLGFKDNVLFCGSRSNGVAKSTNFGTSWEPSNNGLLVFDVRGICSNSSGVYLFTDNEGNTSGVYYTSDMGANWTFRGLTNKDIVSMVNINNVLFALVYDEGVYRSTNSGTNWLPVNDGLQNLRAKHLILNNNNLFYFAESNIAADSPVWKRPVSEVIGIEPISSTIPFEYILNQNYPNPFNPYTNIKFKIPKSTKVKLDIYDVVGREIETLVNENLRTGEYSVQWNAANYPSGVYFYEITAGDFTESKKMVLIK